MREWLTRNLGLKVVSLGTAIALFALVRGAEDAQMTVDVPIIMTPPSAESGKMLVSDLPDRVRLFLQGSRSQLNGMRTDLMSVTVDLTDTSLHYYYFADDQFELPAGVRINRIAPASFPLDWADRIERRVPVQAQLVGTPPDGLMLAASPRVEPVEVRVVGPAERVAEMRVVMTQPLDLAGLVEGSHSRRIPLERADDHVTYEPDQSVRVELDLVPDVAERSFTRPLQVVGGDARGLDPTSIVVVLRGNPSVLDAVDEEGLVVELDVEGLGVGPGQVRPRVPSLPEGVEVVRFEPASVELNVVRE
ncbi:MAG: hypothetical protein H6721_25865 [Sandaracinus sp.]|nr:hypothetical protein [Sandaracinus sp.]MCB9624826.1 hypothetical protein [Sandaracinus sp.]MCB9635560.1 hypothetical protein [Sandaracinus sp.]